MKLKDIKKNKKNNNKMINLIEVQLFDSIAIVNQQTSEVLFISDNKQKIKEFIEDFYGNK